MSEFNGIDPKDRNRLASNKKSNTGIIKTSILLEKRDHLIFKTHCSIEGVNIQAKATEIVKNYIDSLPEITIGGNESD